MGDGGRQMVRLWRESEPGDEIHRYQNSLLFSNEDPSLEFPNLFITIAPAEWKFPMHCSAQGYYPDRGHDMACYSSIHMYQAIRTTTEAILKEPNSQWFTKVLHYVIRLEYQQRGTIHFHVAIWCIPKHPPSHYRGRTGSTMEDRMRRDHQETSPFHAYLESLFQCHIDVQCTSGRLNYINGYTTKAQDSMEFRLESETAYEGPHVRWLTAYRLLCRKTVCIPEVALWFHEAEPMIRSFRVWKCYAPIPWACDKKNNDSERLYEFYLQQDELLRGSFLEYCRLYKVEGRKLKPFSAMGKDTISIGVRYGSEMRDHFIGQLASMHMPHSRREQLHPDAGTDDDFPYVRCLLGFLSYLLQLTLNADGTIRLGSSDHYANPGSYFVPLPIACLLYTSDAADE